MTLDPEVASQLDVLTKSREGLKAAKAMLEQVEAILKLFPDDKAAQRGKQETQRMVERFTKHEAAAHKIISTLSKKNLPPALKKESDAAAKAIKARLVDPANLEVIPWQRVTESWTRNGTLKAVEYQAVFRLKGAQKPYSDWMLVQNTGLDTVKVVAQTPNGYRSPIDAPAISGKDFAQQLLESFKGWPGIKGEAEATANRAQAAKAVAVAINETTEGHYDYEKATISPDNITIEGAYRSDLPKEGESEVGEYRYREMVEREIAGARKRLDIELGRAKDKIDRLEIHDGEKSWIYIRVTLK